MITSSESNCKYLIAPRILRTKKFVCAIAQAPTLVRSEFLDRCLEANELLDPEDFPFEDPEGEEQYELDLRAVLERASSYRGRLLKGVAIWATNSVHGGFDVYRKIVEVNGGRCLLFQGRVGAIRKGGYDSDDEEPKPEPAYLVCGEDDKVLADKFEEMARNAGWEPHVVRADWVLDAALKQEVGEPEKHRHEAWS